MFKDRREAGKLLARELARYKDANPVVLALPRGSVPVGFEVVVALAAPLDVVVARKLGTPGQPELAMGAVAYGDHPEAVLNPDGMSAFGISHDELDARSRGNSRRSRDARKPIEGAAL